MTVANVLHALQGVECRFGKLKIAYANFLEILEISRHFFRWMEIWKKKMEIHQSVTYRVVSDDYGRKTVGKRLSKTQTKFSNSLTWQCNTYWTWFEAKSEVLPEQVMGFMKRLNIENILKINVSVCVSSFLILDSKSTHKKT